MAEKLSKNFTLDELIYSDTAKIKKISNLPTEVHKKTLKHTCEYLLEPLRTLLNEKYKSYKGKKVKKVYIHVNSGYRSEALNKVIPGASKTSGHCKGEAADIVAILILENDSKVELPYTVLYSDIKAWVISNRLSVDQCIQERNKAGKTWVHVAHSAWGKVKDRKQFLKYDGKTYKLDIWMK